VTDATGRPLLVFDGDCSFCTSSARAAQRWLRLEHVEPWQFLDLDELGLAQPAERAVIAALRHAGGFWAVIGGLMNLPGIRQVAGIVYRIVAKYRHRMPGGTAACKLPDA